MNSRAIVVSGLPLEASDTYLISNFQSILSQTIEWFLITVRTIPQKGWKCCFIEFENPEAATRGIDILAGLTVLDRPVLVSRNCNPVYFCDNQSTYSTMNTSSAASLPQFSVPPHLLQPPPLSSPIRSRIPSISDFEFVRIQIASMPIILTNTEIYPLINNLLMQHFLNTSTIRIVRKSTNVMAFVSLHNFSDTPIEFILNSISSTRVLDKFFNASFQKEPEVISKEEIESGILRLNQIIAERSKASVGRLSMENVETETKESSKRSRKIKEEDEDVQDIRRPARKSRRNRSTSLTKSTSNSSPSISYLRGTRSTTSRSSSSGSSSPLLITSFRNQKYRRQESPDPFEAVSASIALDDSQPGLSTLSVQVHATSPSPDPFDIVTPESLSIDYNSFISSTDSLSLEILSRPIEVPSINFNNRTISTQIPTGYLSTYNSQLAISTSAPFIEDEVLQLQYENFLEAQLGAKKHYFDLFSKVQEFSTRSKRFSDIAKFAVEADQVRK